MVLLTFSKGGAAIWRALAHQIHTEVEGRLTWQYRLTFAKLNHPSSLPRRSLRVSDIKTRHCSGWQFYFLQFLMVSDII